MKPLSPYFTFLWVLLAPVFAIQGFGRHSHTYHPMCCTACRRALESHYILCSFDGYVPGGMIDSDASSATFRCRAGKYSHAVKRTIHPKRDEVCVAL